MGLAPHMGLTPAMVVPLALAQFVSTFAGTSMNVAVSAIAGDIGTDVAGIQTAITLFTLTMAALMIPGSKLTDIWGRRRCFIAGLLVYGVGAILAACAQGLGALIVGNSILEGVGSALMIPPVYILITVGFADPSARARYFGVVSGAGGLGACAGPLLGGLLTSTISWRASFVAQIAMLAVTVWLARRIVEPAHAAGPPPRFDAFGAVLSAAGMCAVVLGVLGSSTYGWFTARTDLTVGGTVLVSAGSLSPVWYCIGAGLLILVVFAVETRRLDAAGREPLVRPAALRGRTVQAGLSTQFVQWLVLQGSFFVTSVFLQRVRGYNAIQSGLMLTPEIIGVLAASAAAGRLARRHAQRSLVIGGFALAALGCALLLALVRAHSGIPSFWPGLLLVGTGMGVMLTSSVTVVQSAVPEALQGDISGVSRSVSNLGSSLGTALVGSALVAAAHPGGRPFAASAAMLLVITMIGLAVALVIPRSARPPAGQKSSQVGRIG